MYYRALRGANLPYSGHFSSIVGLPVCATKLIGTRHLLLTLKSWLVVVPNMIRSAIVRRIPFGVLATRRFHPFSFRESGRGELSERALNRDTFRTVELIEGQKNTISFPRRLASHRGYSGLSS
jgi:hypothetical protein